MTIKNPNAPVKYTYAAIVVITICMVGSYIKKKKTEEKILARLETRNKEKELLSKDKELFKYGSEPVYVEVESKTPPKIETVKEEQPVIQDNLQELQTKVIEKSKQAFKTFTTEAYLSFKPPGNFKYIPLDTDDGFSGIYGEDGFQKAKVTGIAYGKTVPYDQVEQFLKSGDGNIPNLSKNPIQSMAKPVVLPPAPAGSGISKATLWAGKLENGDEVNAVFLERADQKGVYLFVLSGPETYFKKNDGSFDTLYESVKTFDNK